MLGGCSETGLDLMKKLKRTLFAAVALPLVASAPALAHPHIFAEARLEIGISEDREVKWLRHVWRFDDLFSSTVLLEFDMNRDNQLDAEELELVASVVHESLAEFGYFQMVAADGGDIKMEPPEKMIASFQDDNLIIAFESRPEETLILGEQVDFGVYDPTFYTAIDFYQDDMMIVAGLPDECSRTVVRPDPEEALMMNQDSLTEAFFNDPGGIDYSRLFATRLELHCPQSG